MTLEELSRKVDIAIGKFYARDSKLLDLNASEWSVAHRIAVYLENLFEDWNIDCEYNRVGLGGSTKHDSTGDYKRPDIIIHHRGMTEIGHNLLIIEVKIINSSEDYGKLKNFTSEPDQNRQVQYQHGLALSFKPVLQKKWFPE